MGRDFFFKLDDLLYGFIVFFALCIHYVNSKSTTFKNVPQSPILFGNISAI